MSAANDTPPTIIAITPMLRSATTIKADEGGCAAFATRYSSAIVMESGVRPGVGNSLDLHTAGGTLREICTALPENHGLATATMYAKHRMPNSRRSFLNRA